MLEIKPALRALLGWSITGLSCSSSAASVSVVLKIRYCQLEQIERREFTYRREGKCRFPMPDEYTGTVVVSARICWLIRIDAYGNSLVPSATQKLLYVLGNAVRVRMWYREFREFEVLCLAYNIKRNIAHSN